ncbi:hypothetical protein M1403_03540 [Patescibacteria group bacterium]|nr:hypothetical protein [Patescibacteria group bacterium]
MAKTKEFADIFGLIIPVMVRNNQLPAVPTGDPKPIPASPDDEISQETLTNLRAPTKGRLNFFGQQVVPERRPDANSLKAPMPSLYSGPAKSQE